MKKFRFRLQRVLDFREIVKSERQRELMLANHKLQSDRDRLSALERAELANRIDEGEPVPAWQVHLSELYGNRLKNEIVQQRLVIIDSEKVADEALARYVEAAREAKALVMLKEKKLAEYREYLQAEDTKFLDELAVQKGNTFAG